MKKVEGDGSDGYLNLEEPNDFFKAFYKAVTLDESDVPGTEIAKNLSKWDSAQFMYHKHASEWYDKAAEKESIWETLLGKFTSPHFAELIEHEKERVDNLVWMQDASGLGLPKEVWTWWPIGEFSNIIISAVPGYDELGANAWRSSNDQIFKDAVKEYNENYNLSFGDEGYWTKERLKAQAMIESGGSREAFMSDPLQVNVPGDWVPKKSSLLGLTHRQEMTPAISARAALEWMRYKGYRHDHSGAEVEYRGNFQALRRYNGNTRVYDRHPGVEHRDWYANEILNLESQM